MQTLKNFFAVIFLTILIAVISNDCTAQKKPQLNNMTLIPAGYFDYGSNSGNEDESPAVKVWIDSFYIDNNEVTNGEYRIFCDSTKTQYPPNPPWDTAYFTKQIDYPVIYVSWDDAVAYAKWIGKRLPTEAEWEKAARAGSNSLYFCGDTITGADANFSGQDSSDIWKNTSPVKSFSPNKFGLYDFYGNVWEWCQDLYQREYYFTISSPNPAGPKTGFQRIIRGGSWDSTFDYLRSTLRGKIDPKSKHSNVGFRCAYPVNKP